MTGSDRAAQPSEQDRARFHCCARREDTVLKFGDYPTIASLGNVERFVAHACAAGLDFPCDLAVETGSDAPLAQPKTGLISGCYLLDALYKKFAEAQQLAAIKKEVRLA